MSNEIVYTHRTSSGLKARILTTNAVIDKLPVVALILGEDGNEHIYMYTANLRYSINGSSLMDLSEYSPWMEVAVDTPVFVGFSADDTPMRRHFAFYKDGKVHTWRDGYTSWTIDMFRSEDETTFAWEHVVIANQNK
jgi:hypothetical protein